MKSNLKNLFGSIGLEIPIIYGGSVNEGRAEALIQTKGVDGFLIGGASLEIESFCNIIETVVKYY